LGTIWGIETRLGETFALWLFVTLTLSAPALASPWGQADGRIFIASHVDYFRTALPDIVFSGGVIESRFERTESNFYVEYGLTQKTTLGAKARYGTTWLTSGATIETASGFSEIEGFVQRQVFRTPAHVGAVKLIAARPSDFSSGVRAGLQSDGFDLEAQFSYGRTVKVEPFKVFMTGEAGYRRRFGDAADQVRLNASIGVEPSSRLLLLVDTFSTVSVGNEKTGGADYDIVKIQPSIVWRVSPRFSAQAGLSEEVAGRNLALGRTFFIGLWTRF